MSSKWFESRLEALLAVIDVSFSDILTADIDTMVGHLGDIYNEGRIEGKEAGLIEAQNTILDGMGK